MQGIKHKIFLYTKDRLDQLECNLSSERLQIYKKLANHDQELTIRLYAWNSALSEALYRPIQGFEVLIRNAFNRYFSEVFSTSWYENPKMQFNINLQQMINKAKNHLIRHNKIINPNSIVPELSFGFWVGLLGRQFETNLWRTHIYSIFANAPKPLLRSSIHERFSIIHQLRNRIAHHEPIVQRNLMTDHNLILETAGWICPITAHWIECHSCFCEVWTRREAKSCTLENS